MYAAAMGIAITRVLVAGTRKVNLYVTMSKYVPISYLPFKLELVTEGEGKEVWHGDQPPTHIVR